MKNARLLVALICGVGIIISFFIGEALSRALSLPPVVENAIGFGVGLIYGVLLVFVAEYIADKLRDWDY